MINNAKERRTIRLNIGSASIIMLFVVLCLTVLSVLSLLSAHSQKRLADRAAAVAANYYAAEIEAAAIYKEILNGDFSRVDAEAGAAGERYFSYVVVIDDNQTLSVRLRSVPAPTPEDAAALEIEYWKIVESRAWTTDESLGVLQVDEELFGDGMPFE
jgi:Tfp pilus assembly protein PilX